MDINLLIESFIDFAQRKLFLSPDDKVYCINKLMFIFKLSKYYPTKNKVFSCDDIDILLDYAFEYCIENKIIKENSYYQKDILQNKIVDVLMPRPSFVREEFYRLYNNSPKDAMDFYYNLGINSSYIKHSDKNPNLDWDFDSSYGKLKLSINLSKPEKDPEEIKEAAIYNKNLKGKDIYPLCALCIENEGFTGSVSQSSRISHRIIPIKLQDKPWFIQFSPYIYYPSHLIALNKIHKPMVINDDTFKNFIDFVDFLPDYFIGSNADLPIVGGSILSHDHYQGGSYTFPLFIAKDRFYFDVDGFDDVNFSIVNWPLTVIRLKSKNKDSIYKASCLILKKWLEFSNESINLFNYSKDIKHNTITPCAYKEDDFYIFHLALRNNFTNDDYPTGIFHTRPSLHNIKRENIGLIEVLGLAILPARLKNEFKVIYDFAKNNTPLSKAISDDIIKYHKNIYENLDLNSSSLYEDILKITGNMFKECLEDCNVFKFDSDDLVLKEFINSFNK